MNGNNLKLLGILVSGWLAMVTSATAGESVVLCHIAQGNPSNFQTIVVGEKAAATHLTHGDLMGACDIPAAERCDDGNACTIDAFLPGTVLCNPTPDPVVCDDKILCTDDSCDPSRGCVSTVTCSAETPICDPGATVLAEACIGDASDCPLELIAAASGWHLRPTIQTECHQTSTGATSVANYIETRDQQPADCPLPNDPCCEEACDCSCSDLINWISFSPPPIPGDIVTGELQAGYIFRTTNSGVVKTCADLFTSPVAAESCLTGNCSNVPIPPVP